MDNHTVKYSLPGRVDVGGTVTAKDIIIATGSVPFVPPGACARSPPRAPPPRRGGRPLRRG